MAGRLKLAKVDTDGLVKLHHARLEHKSVSAGPLQLNRVQSLDSNTLLYANNDMVLKVKYSVPKTEYERGRQGPCISRPSPLEVGVSQLVLSHGQEGREIQCLALHPDKILASIDRWGYLRTKRMYTEADEPQAKRRKVTEGTPMFGAVYQPGYCGVTWVGSDLVCLNHWKRTLIWGDPGQKPERTIHTWLKPTDAAAVFKGDNHVLGVTERNVVSIWDKRVSSRQGMVARFRVGNQPLWSICSLGDKFAVCGSDKVVTVIDSKKWSGIAGWRSGAKLDLLKVLPSPSRPELVYAAGQDNDLVCGEWHTKRKSTVRGFGQSLHVDAPWAGVCVVETRDSEAVVGITQKGSLYVAKDPHCLHLVKQDTPVEPQPKPKIPASSDG